MMSVPPEAASAQAPPAPGSSNAAPVRIDYVVVDAEKVMLRSGPASSYYPFHVLPRGTVLKAVEKRREFRGVRTEGPAFKARTAFVHYPADATDWVEISADGKSGRIMNRTDLIAPNLNADDPAGDSWKRVRHLEPGETITIIRTERKGRFVVHEVPMPSDAIGWIHERYLRPASEAEIAALRTALEGPVLAREEPATEAPAPIEPTATPDPASATETAALPADEPPAPGESGPPGEAVAGATPSAEMGQPIESNAPAAVGGIDAATPVAARTPKERLADLEVAFKQLQKEPIETAEVQPLLELYRGLAGDVADESPAVARYANARVEQLTIWGDLQERRVEILALQQRLQLTTEEVEAARRAAETTGGYAAVGRLAASTIFEGARLPRLLRLQDAATGRTIAYLRPDDKAFDLVGMLGQLVGVIGDKHYDPGLRLNIITPRRIDLLLAERREQTASSVD